MSFGPNPWQQQHWDLRAAGNFMAKNAACNAADDSAKRTVGLSAIGVAILADERLVAVVPGFRRCAKRERSDKGQCAHKLVNNFHFNLR